MPTRSLARSLEAVPVLQWHLGTTAPLDADDPRLERGPVGLGDLARQVVARVRSSDEFGNSYDRFACD